MNQRSPDHIILGGGIIGLLTAYYLNQAGAEVLLVERGETGRESSWAGGGILSPLYPWRYPATVTRLVKKSQLLYPALIDQLNEATGIDAELVNSGLLVLDSEGRQQAISWAERNNVNLQKISPQDVSQLQQGIKNTGEDALWLPDVCQVRNPRLVRALKHYLLQQGVVLQENSGETSVLTRDGRVLGVKTKSETIHCENVIVACGAWSAKLVKNIGITLDIEPVLGQMILIRAAADTIGTIVLDHDRYIIPRRDGCVLVGSTLEHTGFEKQTTAIAKSDLLNTALNIAPGLKSFPVTHHWAGLRPGSTDGVPTIGAHPSTEGLFINSGHYRNGVVMAPASASMMADIVLRRTSGHIIPNYEEDCI